MSMTEYVTATAKTPAELDREVNEKLKQGYVLYGNPYAAGEGEGHVCQAMTREVKATMKVG